MTRSTRQRGWLAHGPLLALSVTKQLLRAVEDPIGLLDGGLHLFDLPVRLLAQPSGFLDKLPPARNGLCRFTQIGGLGKGSLALSGIAPSHPG